MGKKGFKKIRTLAVLFSIFLISCSVPARPSKQFSLPDGFRGVKWGTEISALIDMEKVEQERTSDNGLVWYTRKGDSLAMGQAKLEGIYYGFWMGNFGSVWIDFEGDGNFETLKKELFQQFGKVPESVKPFYAWEDKETEISLSYSKDRRKGTLSIISRRISEERRAYSKQKEKEERLKQRGF